jgi:hypothetical protein
VLDQTVPTFLGAIRRGFEDFGGAPSRLKPDNLKSAMLISALGERYQEDFFRLCQHYGTLPDAARPMTPRDKGRTERDIGFNFDFQPKLDVKLIKTLASCDFVERRENVIFVGQPGTGKTHLAIALGSWAEVFPDPVIASAVLDRLVHHAHLVPIVGESFRM